MAIGTWDIMGIPYHTETKTLGFSITHFGKVCIWRCTAPDTERKTAGNAVIEKI
jgi:hypothetical protein